MSRRMSSRPTTILGAMVLRSGAVVAAPEGSPTIPPAARASGVLEEAAGERKALRLPFLAKRVDRLEATPTAAVGR